MMKLFSEKPAWRVKEIATRLGINEDTAANNLKDLSYSGLLPLDTEKHVWKLIEGSVVPQLTISLSYAEAGGLYLAGRLLAQIQDEQNWHISMALKKLLDALPPTLQEQQQELLSLLMFSDDALPAEQRQRDMSQIFQVLTSGWITRHRIRLTYQPPKSGAFECFFEPYLLEPSAIGRTIYAIGKSSIKDQLRTFKLERILKAELMDGSFVVPANFDGPKLLRYAWGVMYGDEEPVTVRLRFHANVTKRLHETRWHPTQSIQLTTYGCEWSAQIGDITEIEP
ncbi:helix-turn-helix transcriptional regulator [Dictyobacter formicarum]|nr:WYL domain-containing protein [Dictyobacter formicarum]